MRYDYSMSKYVPNRGVPTTAINLDPFTGHIAWRDRQRYAPIHWARYFAYSFELALILVTGYAMVANNNPGFVFVMLSMVVSVGLAMLIGRYLHSRWWRHCKVRIRKFAEVNSLTYEESAAWSGTDASLAYPRGAMLRPKDKYIVSGIFAGHHFRLGLYEVAWGGRIREFLYHRAFLRIDLGSSAAIDYQKGYATTQALPVFVEYKGRYVYICSPQWSFGMRKVAQSIPALFAMAALLTKK